MLYVCIYMYIYIYMGRAYKIFLLLNYIENLYSVHSHYASSCYKSYFSEHT